MDDNIEGLNQNVGEANEQGENNPQVLNPPQVEPPPQVVNQKYEL